MSDFIETTGEEERENHDEENNCSHRIVGLGFYIIIQ